MTCIDRATTRRVVAALFALAVTLPDAEARGFGGVRAGAFGPRVGAWGRPLGPVRPGGALGGGVVRPGLAAPPPYLHPRWRRGYWGYGYGLGGFGLGLGFGGLFGAYGDPWYDDAYIVRPPVYVAPVEVPVETEVVVDDSAAIAACARRFKTYDPRTRTYIGKGYVRRRCP